MKKQFVVALFIVLLAIITTAIASAEHRVAYSDYPYQYTYSSVSRVDYHDEPHIRVRTYYSNAPFATGRHHYYENYRVGYPVATTYYVYDTPRYYRSYQYHDYYPAHIIRYY